MNLTLKERIKRGIVSSALAMALAIPFTAMAAPYSARPERTAAPQNRSDNHVQRESTRDSGRRDRDWRRDSGRRDHDWNRDTAKNWDRDHDRNWEHNRSRDWDRDRGWHERRWYGTGGYGYYQTYQVWVPGYFDAWSNIYIPGHYEFHQRWIPY